MFARPRMARTLRAAILPLAIAGLAIPSRAQLYEVPDQFEVVPLQGDYDLPVDLTFTPDGSFFVAEKRGVVWYHDGTAKQTLPFIDLQHEVNLEWDRGLLAIAVHPGFVPDAGNTSWVYLLYTVSPVPGEDWPYDQDDRYSFSRLTRYRARQLGNDVIAAPSSRRVLLGNQESDGRVPDGIASLHNSHSNGTLLFADDGSLLVTTGEGAHWNLLDTGGFDPAGFDDFVHPVSGLRGPTPIDQDSGAFRSQDLRSLAGKVLRLNPGSGRGYPSNPFYNGNPESNPSRIWALGLRNPFRVSMLPGTGSEDPADGDPNTLLLADVGWLGWEEINVCHGSENYGWPCFEGDSAQPDFQAYDSGATPFDYPDCQSTPPGALTTPAVVYNRFNPADMRPQGMHFDVNGQPAPGFTGSCVMTGTAYQGGSYPAEYVGRTFFHDFSGRWLKTMETDGFGNPVAFHDFGINFLQVVDLETHPTLGDLHFVHLGNGLVGQVLRIRYGSNSSPLAVAQATPTNGDPPLLVQLSAAGSSDPDDNPIEYLWDFGDLTPTSTLESPNHTYTAPGIYRVSLTVTEVTPEALSSVAELVVVVGNTPPTGEILSPLPGQLLNTPETVQLIAGASDFQDLEEELIYIWTVDRFENFVAHPKVFTTSGQQASFSVEGLNDPNLEYFRVNLKVFDSGGLTDQDEVFIYPRDRVFDRTGTASPIARIQSMIPPEPTGSGHIDIEVIRDQDRPVVGTDDPLRQFDTSHGGDQGPFDWVGFDYSEHDPIRMRFVALIFQEGQHFAEGGWFEDFNVEVRQNGVWNPVAGLRVSPDYPFQVAGVPSFDGINFQTYVLSFDPMQGDGIRISGDPGGSLGFISVAELRALTVELPAAPDPLEDVTSQGSVIARVFELAPPMPLGRGSPDPATIRNGTYPPVGSQSEIAQYDTFHFGDQGSLDWVGYRFDQPVKFARLVYQEGLHNSTGGRFDRMWVELQADDSSPWIAPTGLSVQPAYPGQANLAATYETFTIDFDPMLARSIRIVGEPVMPDSYVGIGELRVFAIPTSDPCPGGPEITGFCIEAPNSQGAGAVLSAQGCGSIGLNNFGLLLTGGVPGQVGLVAWGNETVFDTVGDGFSCVGGGKQGIMFPAFLMDSSGQGLKSIDLSAPLGRGVRVQPGSTWHFQAVYRDDVRRTGSGLNFSRGLTVTFAP